MGISQGTEKAVITCVELGDIKLASAYEHAYLGAGGCLHDTDLEYNGSISSRIPLTKKLGTVMGARAAQNTHLSLDLEDRYPWLVVL